jgi:hypothetical protein
MINKNNMNNVNNNDNLKNLHMQLKSIMEGCDTISDALQFGTEYINKYPDMKSLIISYINSINYPDSVDIKTKQKIMIDIVNAEYMEEAHSIINSISPHTTDNIFIKTLEKLMVNKKMKNIEKIKFIKKKCPHCKHVINMPFNTSYVICGYHNEINGYDWYGCGRDWCFSCEKILCKKWEDNILHLEPNRLHTHECCSNHALLNNKVYPDDYCMCNNIDNYCI